MDVFVGFEPISEATTRFRKLLLAAIERYGLGTEDISNGTEGYHPAGTMRQADDAFEGEYLPAAHNVQYCAPDIEYDPGPQSTHGPSPTSLLCEPAGQAVHSALTLVLVQPASHMQSVEREGECDPRGHGKQSSV